MISCRDLLMLAVVFSSCAGFTQQQAADTILLHGRIYTVDRNHPWAEALAIRDGKLVAVGTEKEISGYRSTATKIIDAKGHLVLPGFTDCHVHFLDGSLSLERVNVEGISDLQEVLRRIKA